MFLSVAKSPCGEVETAGGGAGFPPSSWSSCPRDRCLQPCQRTLRYPRGHGRPHSILRLNAAPWHCFAKGSHGSGSGMLSLGRGRKTLC